MSAAGDRRDEEGTAFGADSPARNPVSFDRVEALERLGGDELLLAEVVALFLQDSPRLVGEVRAAAAEGDRAALRRTAHSLKGSLGYFGTTPAFEAAWQLETLARDGPLGTAGHLLAVLERELERLQITLRGYLIEPVTG